MRHRIIALESRRTQRQLHCSTQAAGLAIHECDAITAVFRQVVLGVCDDEHVRQQRDADCPKPTGIHMPLQGIVSVVVAWVEHRIDCKYRDLAAATVLPELRVINAAVMIHHVDRAAVFAQDEIGGIAERPAIQSVQRYLATADNGICREIVDWI